MIYQIKQREAELRGEERGRAEGRAEGEIKGRAEGRAEGEIKGRAEEKKLMVLKMLAKQLPEELITDLSGLSIREVDEIRAEMTK